MFLSSILFASGLRSDVQFLEIASLRINRLVYWSGLEGTETSSNEDNSETALWMILDTHATHNIGLFHFNFSRQNS